MTDTIQHFDVIIVGAGPAGSACAMTLANSGLKVALVDKASFPRDKICGDAIPSISFKAMHAINPKWEAQLREVCNQTVITSVRFYLSKRKSISYKWRCYASNSKRMVFDDFLFNIVKEQTNTVIFDNSKVSKLLIKPNGVDCILQNGTVLSASMIIGCDGCNSVVKRSFLQQPKDNNVVYAAVRAYYKGIAGTEEGVNECYMLDEVQGYFWIFPLPNNYFNIGFGILNDKLKKADTANNIRKKLDLIIQSERFKKRFENAELVGNVNGFGLPIWTKKERISGERFILTGDAASLIDPIAGHGIDKAIWSGMFAANQVKNCFKNNNFSSNFMEEYDRNINKKFGSELKLHSRMMNAFIKYPFILKILNKLPVSQRVINFAVRNLKM
jgi:menaquinone-9 beta-reductase